MLFICTDEFDDSEYRRVTGSNVAKYHRGVNEVRLWTPPVRETLNKLTENLSGTNFRIEPTSFVLMYLFPQTLFP